MDNTREKLIELITGFYGVDPMYYGVETQPLVDHLIANGVTLATDNHGGDKTHADRIRAMSDEELAEFLCGVYDDDNCGVYQDECGKFINGTTIIDYDQHKIAEWLKQPVED